MADFGPTAATSEDDWTLLTRGVGATGVRDDGDYVNPLSVFADSTAATVKVRPGIATAGGLRYGRLPAVTNLTIANNGVAQPRTDSVVLRLNSTTGTAYPFVVQGTAGVGAPVPVYSTSPRIFDVWLATVAVPASYAGAAIPATWVTDRRLVVKDATRRSRGRILYTERITDAGPTSGTAATQLTITSFGTIYIPAGRLITVSAGGFLQNESTTLGVVGVRLLINESGAVFTYSQKTLGANNTPPSGLGDFHAERSFTSVDATYVFTVAMDCPVSGSVRSKALQQYPSWLKIVDEGAA